MEAHVNSSLHLLFTLLDLRRDAAGEHIFLQWSFLRFKLVFSLIILVLISKLKYAISFKDVFVELQILLIQAYLRHFLI